MKISPSWPKRTRWALALLLGLVVGQLSVWAQADIVVQNRVFTNGEVQAYWGTSTLQTMDTVTVQAGASVVFGAGGTVRLSPGFSVKAGAFFQAFRQALTMYNPSGYYTGGAPLLVPLWASPEVELWSPAGAFAFHKLDIAVWNAAGTAPLAGAPVLIVVESGDAWLATSNGSTTLVKTLTLTADSLGTVQCYLKQATTANTASVLRVIAGGSSYVFRTRAFDTSLALSGPDADSDGLPDALETVLNTRTDIKADPSYLPGMVVF
jgi:hypothetical protein